jgi:hypothetical protein
MVTFPSNLLEGEGSGAFKVSSFLDFQLKTNLVVNKKDEILELPFTNFLGET